MKKTLILILLIQTAFLVNAQDTIRLPDENLISYANDSITNDIGFGCGYAGTPTPSVEFMHLLVFEDRIELIRKLIYSKQPSVRYLSAVFCEEFEKEKLLTLNNKEKSDIEFIYHSKDTVFLCSGCTYRAFVTIDELEHSKEDKLISMRIGARHRAHQYISQYKKNQR